MDSHHCCLNWLAARSCNLRCRQRGQLSLTIEVTRDVCLLCIFPISNCTWILAPQHPDQLLLPLLLLSSWSAAAAAAVVILISCCCCRYLAMPHTLHLTPGTVHSQSLPVWKHQKAICPLPLYSPYSACCLFYVPVYAVCPSNKSATFLFCLLSLLSACLNMSATCLFCLLSVL